MAQDQNTVDAQDLLHHFRQILGVNFNAPTELMNAAQSAIDGCKGWVMYDQEERERRLIALINSKLKLNKERFQEFLDRAAERRIFLNYHDKAELLECLDYGDKPRFERWLQKGGYDPCLSTLFRPITVHESLEGLYDLLRTGKVNRSDAKDCDLSERQSAILGSLFGSYIFHTFPAQALHSHFNSDCRKEYQKDFYSHLMKFYPESLSRDCALIFLCIDQNLANGLTVRQLRNVLCSFVRKSYDRLANHCFFAVQIKPFREGTEDGQWRLFSDLILYAEKHREVSLQTGYFHPQKIEAATKSHIPELDDVAAGFDLANEGFFFRDCFILSQSDIDIKDEFGQAISSDEVDILLMFDKNERDETVIPCPSCRSKQVRGNSYPVLGVRSWECQNAICPDRSAFDRGNRYSLSSIIKQEAINSDADLIPASSLKQWKLDVVFGINDDDVADMLIRHFSLHGDTVVFVNASSTIEEKHGRRILHETLDINTEANSGVYAAFQASAFFKRIVIDRKSVQNNVPIKVSHKIKGADVYHGDCFEVLSALRDASIDGAATSPPYYNARSYSDWPNIYCYLYDMYNSAKEVFRVLKPGTLYLFNVFDYFDNENIVALSAMGKKRMILGAYIVNLFNRIGFELDGNMVWYKGEIEGKRNFNQGNCSPYYQFPFNCWEHCFVFRKPGPAERIYSFPTILDVKPVIKIIRGENILGHTAPFPRAIPRLLISQMSDGECILDPFSGSMTTGRTAHRHGLRSISIELHKDYCSLGISLLEKEACETGNLFLLTG